MGKVVIRTKKDLERIIKKKSKRIFVKGELAEQLNKSMQIKKASKWAIGLLAASLAVMPITGGLSFVAVAPIAAATGLKVALIIAVAALGISLVLSISRDYKKVKFKAERGDIEAELELERLER